MYRQHNPECRERMKESVDGMMQGYALVSHSIRVKTSKLSERMDEYRRYGFNTKYIQNWDIKKKGADYVYKNRYELYNESMKIIRSKKKGADTDFVMRWLEVPGLGIPKAAFVAQLMNGWAGCLDVHNIRKYLPDVNAKRGTPSYWQTASDSKETKLRKVKDYLAFCRMLGGSGVLWDQWCSARPLEMPELIDGEYVSSLHPQWLTA